MGPVKVTLCQITLHSNFRHLISISIVYILCKIFTKRKSAKTDGKNPQIPGVGDALELGDALLPGDGDVCRRHDDLRGHVHLEAGVHLQHDVIRVLLLPKLGVSGTCPEIESVENKSCWVEKYLKRMKL